MGTMDDLRATAAVERASSRVATGDPGALDGIQEALRCVVRLFGSRSDVREIEESVAAAARLLFNAGPAMGGVERQWIMGYLAAALDGLRDTG